MPALFPAPRTAFADMPKLSPDRELQLQVTKWILSPGNNRDALGFAAIAVLEAEHAGRGFPGIAALTELKELAREALQASAAGRVQDRERINALKVASALAKAELDAWRKADEVAQDAAERKRFGGSIDHLEGAAVEIAAPRDPYKERADL
jgi:hypothetical protein